MDHLFSVGFSPFDVAAYATRYADRHSPWSGITEYAKGRKILLAPDRETLLAALREEPEPDLASSIGKGSTGEILGIIRGAPRNLFLRERIYQLLASAGKHGDLARIAGEFAAGKEPALEDRKAHLLGRLRTADAGSAPALIGDLRQALAGDPREAVLYLWTGEAHELAGDDPRLARAAYGRVLDLVDEGPVAEEARRKMEKLLDPAGTAGGTKERREF